MKLMKIEEIKEMVGTEFIYVFEDKTEIPAVVAAFDEKIGLTILATSLKTSDGFDLSGDVDENGNLCLIGVFADDRNFIKICSGVLRSVKCLGSYHRATVYGYDKSVRTTYTEDPVCVFN